MGKTLDALLGRSFKASKFKTLLNLAISRLSVLKNQRRTRCSIARSDVVQLLQISEQERALIRAELVIKEQNLLDVFGMIEGYCILLSERIKLIELEKNCPEELQEAISSIIFATSRCGEIPELQEMRYVFASRYGREFALRATELRNSCGVNPKIIQKLSTRQPSLENRMKVLKEIADENGVSLQLEEAHSMAIEEKVNKKEDNLNAKKTSTGLVADFVDHLKEFPEETSRAEGLSVSVNQMKQYKDVAEAAQEAFLSAAYAAAAARAAVDLSRTSSGGSPDDLNNPKNTQRKQVLNSNSEVKSRTVTGEDKYSRDTEDYVSQQNEVHSVDNYNLNFEGSEAARQSDEIIDIKQVDPRDSEKNLKSNEIENENNSKKINSIRNKDEREKRGAKQLYYSSEQTASDQAYSKKDDEEQISAGLVVKSPQKLNTVKTPFSVRTRR